MTANQRIRHLYHLKAQCYAAAVASSRTMEPHKFHEWSAYQHYSRLLDKEMGYADTGT